MDDGLNFEKNSYQNSNSIACVCVCLCVHKRIHVNISQNLFL